MDHFRLREVIESSKPGATHDGRLFLTYQMLKDSAATIGVELASAARVFSAMRELGFEEIKGGAVSRYAIGFNKLISLYTKDLFSYKATRLINRGFNKDRPAYLYFRTCKGFGLRDGVTKVGISGMTEVEKRAYLFRPFPGYKTELAHLVFFESGSVALDSERSIKKAFSGHSFKVDVDGPRFLGNGMTEVFTRDVFHEWIESEHGREVLKQPGVRVERIGA